MTEKEFLEISRELTSFKKHLILTSIDVIYILEKFVKPKAEFKVGDRVACYSTMYGKWRTISKILKIDEENDLIYLDKCQWVHKKQCRRLRKK